MTTIRWALAFALAAALSGCNEFQFMNRLTGGYTDRALQTTLDATRQAGQDGEDLGQAMHPGSGN